MKSTRYFGLLASLVFLVLLSGCSVGYMKDKDTGLKVNYKGFSMEDVYLAVDKNKVNTNDVALGRTVYVQIMGLKGYKIFNGKASIGCEIVVLSKSNDTVLYAKDVFDFTDGGVDSESLENININISVLKPMKVGETYTWQGRFWDKYSEATMSSNVEIHVVENTNPYHTKGLAVNTKGVAYSEVYLSAYGKFLENGDVYKGDKLQINVNGAKGFAVIDSAFQMAYFAKLTAANGKQMFDFYDTLNFSSEIDNLYSKMNVYDEMAEGEKYIWFSEFKDLNSDALLSLQIELNVVK